jgi:hypothetical protein
MPRRVFVHRAIAESAAIPNELEIGWTVHYVTGIVYGPVYLYIVRVLFSSDPTLISALVFGLVTVTSHWFIMQPRMGAGVFATQTARPGMTRLIDLSMHGVFGISLYVGWLLIR